MTSSRWAWIMALVLASPVAQGATLRVPSEYLTIQAGIDAAVAGDSVLVAPGFYSDHEVRAIPSGVARACVFMKDGVVLTSEGGSAVTTIHLPDDTVQPQIIYGNGLPSHGTVVEGFTLTAVPTGYSAVYFLSIGGVMFRDCVFRDLTGFVTNAGLNVNNGDLTVIGCQFINCFTTGGGAGIYHDDGRVEVRDSYFENCDQRAIAIEADDTGSEAIIEGCRFVNCRGTGGGAIAAGQRPAGMTVRGCTFVGNTDTGTGGGAVTFGGFGPRLVEECLFLFNQTVGLNGLGGAVKVNGARGTVRRCTFVGSHQSVGEVGGAAVAFVLSGTNGSRLENNIIYGSTGSPAVSGWSGASLVSACNVFWANGAGISGEDYTPGPTDRELDPLFCDVVGGDYTLSENSPCLPENSPTCGAIGLFGQGCGVVSVDSKSWGQIKNAFREGVRP